MAKIALDDLGAVIEKELADYGKSTTEKMRTVVDSISEETIEALKISSPKQSGRYAKGWKSKQTVDTTTAKTKTIHNRISGLTHLLEHGHAKQNGGRVEGKKHIAPVEESAIKNFEAALRQELGG